MVEPTGGLWNWLWYGWGLRVVVLGVAGGCVCSIVVAVGLSPRLLSCCVCVCVWCFVCDVSYRPGVLKKVLMYGSGLCGFYWH